MLEREASRQGGLVGARKRGSDAPRLEDTDTLELESRDALAAHHEGDLGDAIRAALASIGGVGPGAERAYQGAIEVLRSHGHDASRQLASEYQDLPEDAYIERWALVQLIAELRDVEALEILETVIAAPIPPERRIAPR